MDKLWAEIQIHVPNGIVAAKCWGNPDESSQKILALHGWQDNAGTFDCLIPLLNANAFIVAIDFPGHGWSSHLPSGCPYNDVIYLLTVKRILSHFQWKRVSFLGHSMGGAIALYFASLYPDMVDKIISLDMLKPLTIEANVLMKLTGKILDDYLSTEKKIADGCPSPMYTMEQAIQKLIEGHSKFGIITDAGARTLLIRGDFDLILELLELFDFNRFLIDNIFRFERSEWIRKDRLQPGSET